MSLLSEDKANLHVYSKKELIEYASSLPVDVLRVAMEIVKKSVSLSRIWYNCTGRQAKRVLRIFTFNRRWIRLADRLTQLCVTISNTPLREPIHSSVQLEVLEV